MILGSTEPEQEALLGGDSQGVILGALAPFRVYPADSLDSQAAPVLLTLPLTGCRCSGSSPSPRKHVPGSAGALLVVGL